MAFNLNEFKSHVIAPQRSNKFEVTIDRAGGNAEDFRAVKYLAENVQFPQFEFSSMYSVPRYGFGLQDVFPAGPKYKELIVSFIMEQGGGIYDKFRQWINDISPITYTPGEGSSTERYYTLSYKTDYEATIQVALLGESDESSPGMWHFHRAWPVNIIGDPLSWESADGYVTFAVTFIYYNMAFTPGERPVEGDISNRYRNVVVNADPGSHPEITRGTGQFTDPDTGETITQDVNLRRIVSNRRIGPNG